MASSEREESPPSRHSDINVTDRDTVTKIADITFNNFKQYFDSKIGSLKRELKEDATNKSERVVKQLKSEHSYKFKFNGNQVQHEFNSDIDYEVSRIKRAAEREDYSKVRDICSDIRDKIHKRNKCIKIADKSPAGWDTVREYMSDDLASDSEDEKKIRSAETRAIRGKKQKEQARVKSRNGGNPSVRTAPEDLPSTSNSTNRNFRPYQYEKQVGPKSTDRCFRCNGQGHWRRDCTRYNKTTNGN
ncbi:unnamed protein product [Mytilus edulis]|uniref:CCHC-type domain-containing protein n=1 Tax=Mytilus edulis TaxID=6550 RepID=A0A8S3SUG7_MYTED|nr:unnamed protein product [Mytilus edulis]